MRPWSVWRRMLIVLAVAFLLSAWLYCLATMHTERMATLPDAGKPSELIVFFRDHGTKILALLLAGLALCAAAMVITDRHPSCVEDPGARNAGIVPQHDEAGAPTSAHSRSAAKEAPSRYDEKH